MIGKWKTPVNNQGIFEALFTNISKAFDCILHDLRIAKLESYGFYTNAMKIIHNYPSNRSQRLKINSSYSIWKCIFYGVRESSILGPLLFNIHLCDLFCLLKNTDIRSYADHNIFVKANNGKSHLLMSGTETTHTNIDGLMIKSSQNFTQFQNIHIKVYKFVIL